MSLQCSTVKVCIPALTKNIKRGCKVFPGIKRSSLLLRRVSDEAKKIYGIGSRFESFEADMETPRCDQNHYQNLSSESTRKKNSLWLFVFRCNSPVHLSLGTTNILFKKGPIGATLEYIPASLTWYKAQGLYY